MRASLSLRAHGHLQSPRLRTAFVQELLPGLRARSSSPSLEARPQSTMESNKDEAVKCLAIAQRRRNAGDLAGARRFCQKSLSLFSTPEATKLLEIIESDIASADAGQASSSGSSAGPSSSSEQPFASAAEAHQSASGARHRHTGSAPGGGPKANGSAEKGTEKKREYKPEQAAVVKRVRSCKITQYYEILSVKKECEDVEIKKAYRKVCARQSLVMHSLTAHLAQLALSLHPDKNGAPGADEAFKSTFPLTVMMPRCSPSLCSGVESIPGAIW